MNILKDVDKFLQDRNQIKWEEKIRNYHYPSDYFSCNRQLWYKWMHEPMSNPPETHNLLKADIGNVMHDMLTDYMVQMGYNIDTEKEFWYADDRLEKSIHGRIDGVIIQGDDEYTGLEIKTTFGRGAVQVAKTRTPKEEWLWQIGMYLMCCKELSSFILVVIARDSAYRTSFLVQLKDGVVHYDLQETDITVDRIMDKLVQTEAVIKHSNPPKRDYKVAIKNGEIKDMFQKNNKKYKTDWQCKYCNYMNTCWNNVVKEYTNSDNSEVFDNE